MSRISIIFSILILIVVFSCDDSEICEDELEAMANASFYKNISGIAQDTTFEAIIVKGIQTPDTILPDTFYTKNSVLLHLPQGADSCRFVLSFAVYDSVLSYVNDTVEEMIWDISYFIDDTLQINFSKLMYLISTECGFTHEFKLENISYTTNSIQTADIVDPNIDPLNEENIRIRF